MYSVFDATPALCFSPAIESNASGMIPGLNHSIGKRKASDGSRSKSQAQKVEPDGRFEAQRGKYLIARRESSAGPGRRNSTQPCDDLRLGKTKKHSSGHRDSPSRTLPVPKLTTLSAWWARVWWSGPILPQSVRPWPVRLERTDVSIILSE